MLRGTPATARARGFQCRYRSTTCGRYSGTRTPPTSIGIAGPLSNAASWQNVPELVDATFGHRIDKFERAEFDEAVAHNELVAPPAGAIGRGDAFVLSIAKKAKATILSNDSFQEFHGEYLWLFEEGRLVGGKPVPNVGWIFTPRTPVRGPKSRVATRDADRARRRAAADLMPRAALGLRSAVRCGTARLRGSSSNIAPSCGDIPSSAKTASKVPSEPGRLQPSSTR